MSKRPAISTQLLQAEGLEVWFDKDSIDAGKDWKYEISRAIREAKVFLACISSKSIAKRGFVQAELKSALDILVQVPENDIFIIPVRVDPCDVPGAIAHLQYVNLWEENALARLAHSLKRKLQQAAAPIPPTVAPLKFAEIRIDEADKNWTDDTTPDRHNPYRRQFEQIGGQHFEQSLKLVEFVDTADLLLDITVLNISGGPVILNELGIHVVFAYHIVYCYGFPRPAKIPKCDAYELELPELFRELYSEESGEVRVAPQPIDRYASVRLRDPIYLPPAGPYRFSLRLRRFAGKMPNYSFFRLWARTDEGEAESHVIRTFTW